MILQRMLQKNDFEKILLSDFFVKIQFFEFYIMGAAGIDFWGIAHVKLGVIAHQKI